MMLIEETPVPDASLPVDAFKAHLRLGSGFGQDDLQDAVLRSFLRASLAAIEVRTSKALITRVFTWSVSQWRNAGVQVLPLAPITTLSRVALVARDGTETDVDADAYWLERDAQSPRLRPTGTCLPRIPEAGSALIAFEAGFGTAWDALPADLQQSVLMLAAHYYEYRNDTALSDGCMPFGVSSLIERFKPMRLGARS